MIWSLSRWSYTFLFTVLLPFVFLRLWVKGKKLPLYRKRMGERLGQVAIPPLQESLWVHAVSVGETLAAIPLIKRLRAEYPNTPILMTTTTPTGSERVQAAFKDSIGKMFYHSYLPYDLPFILKPFFRRINPKLLILMETEIWPNLLAVCDQKKVPVLIANARLSPHSFKRYSLLGSLMKPILQPVNRVAAQSQIDVSRFASLGVEKERISEMGNIKFDLQLPSYLSESGKKLRETLGKERLVFIAASTHEGEEEIALNVYQSLKERFPALLLIIVPRHPERFGKVFETCAQRNLIVRRRSQNEACTDAVDVFLGDTMGELLLFYAASDIALVGGSFVPVGGHNLLEPAALGLPVLTGPQLFNFIAISEMLIEAKGASVVQDEKGLQEALVRLIENPHLRAEQGHQAKMVVEQNRGALDKLMGLIGNAMKQPQVV